MSIILWKLELLLSQINEVWFVIEYVIILLINKIYECLFALILFEQKLTALKLLIWIVKWDYLRHFKVVPICISDKRVWHEDFLNTHLNGFVFDFNIFVFLVIDFFIIVFILIIICMYMTFLTSTSFQLYHEFLNINSAQSFNIQCKYFDSNLL